ncbi:hypothetical protein SAMN05192583_0059 [Sphingomonas gellani]|uniref:Uncharacterized protein n=1 Tax=Sphingomonas gellani TaxID=1166340 RepID=A0A1H7Y2W0_9SPHN|nr:hypothetical protein [Sphingomonas gellani]SEM40204.1 hypothetical protein SAMN05192583_0059 [Sphingomonas gellani]
MATRTNIPEPVLELLWNEYCSTIKYQREKNSIKVTMNFDEYLSLWSMTRINTMAKKIEMGQKSIDYYMKNKLYGPVCGWVSREARILGGTMTVADAKIMKAEDSKRMFQFQVGDKHGASARASIGDAKRGKPQSEEHVKKRTAGQIGKKRGPMSEEAKAKLRSTRAANNAAKEKTNDL